MGIDSRRIRVSSFFSAVFMVMVQTGCMLLIEPANYFGEIEDPVGDSLDGLDLVYASVTVGGGQALLRVRFDQETFDPDTSLAVFCLDTDQDPGTGHPGSNSGGVDDNGIIGLDYLVYMGSAYLDGEAQVKAYLGEVNLFEDIGFFRIGTFADGYDVMIPLLTLGEDDGRMNFKVTCSRQVSENGYTGVLDYATDIGLGSGTTESP